MSFLNMWDNVADFTDELADVLLKEYGDEVTEQDVWEMARHSKEMPILGNVYQHILFSRLTWHFTNEVNKQLIELGKIKNELSEEELKCKCYINSVGSSLELFGRNIRTEEDYWKAVDEAIESFDY